MKKITTTIILMVLIGITTSFAQSKQQMPSENSKEAMRQADPLVYTQEQALLIQADDYNPARVEQSLAPDPKMNGADIIDPEAYGPANALEAPENLVEEERDESTTDLPEQSVLRMPKTQPEGEVHGSRIDYRNISNPGDKQPEGAHAGTHTNYREQNGSSTQPPGEIPNK